MRPTEPGERWLPTQNYPGYWVSDHGRVWSDKSQKLLSLHQTGGGYLQVRLAGKTLLVHRLVAEHFIPNLYEDPEVNHLDGVKTNNHFSNLEWCTPLQNTHHAIAIGLRKGRVQEQIIDDADWWMAR